MRLMQKEGGMWWPPGKKEGFRAGRWGHLIPPTGGDGVTVLRFREGKEEFWKGGDSFPYTGLSGNAQRDVYVSFQEEET